MLDKLVGNASLKASLSGALSADKLAHCVMLCGEEGTGTGFTALSLAGDYLYKGDEAGIHMLQDGLSSEIITLEGEGASGDIRIDTVRAMREAIFSTSLSCEGRCVIVYGADHLNASSANALLKTLEEPPRDVLFILTAPSAAAVLPTIRSRCAVYNLAPASESECIAYLNSKYPALPNAEELSAIYGGRIGCCCKVSENKDAKASLDKALVLAECCANSDEYTALLVLSTCEKDRPGAVRLFADLRAICSSVLRGGNIKNLAREQAAAALSALYEANVLLSGNVNAKLVYTQVAAKLTAV